MDLLEVIGNEIIYVSRYAASRRLYRATWRARSMLGLRIACKLKLLVGAIALLLESELDEACCDGGGDPRAAARCRAPPTRCGPCALYSRSRGHARRRMRRRSCGTPSAPTCTARAAAPEGGGGLDGAAVQGILGAARAPLPRARRRRRRRV